ncbi:MAG: methyltransferase family protein [Actinomycetales bacterium]
MARVGIIVLFSWSALSNVVASRRQWSGLEPTWHKVAAVGSSALGIAFCALVVWAYLRRSRASITDRSPLVWVVAPLATVIPLVMAAVPPAPSGAVRDALVLGLTLAGLSWSVWSVRTLSTNLSVVPQARVAVTDGPYRLVRHPLYFGEIVALCGLALHVGRWEAGLVILLEVALQIYRASREERLLARAIPGYREYAEHTRRLIPGVW